MATARSKDTLSAYRQKRDFTRTAEPAGVAAEQLGHSFVVQMHAARRLHWDFRLEVEGVLKSWAVTRGPSADPDDKRLAVRTEDHPLDYASFEGVIPAGEYGGGTVMVWDYGEWAPIAGKSAADLDDGHLHFTLDGKRMKGEWLLVRMKGRPGEKRENWLLRKIADAEAKSGDTLVAHALTSAMTGRSMAEIAAGKNPKPSHNAPSASHQESIAPKPVAAGKARAKPGRLPAFRAVQLATLVDAVPTGNGWMHEIKFDGYRALVACAGDDIRIFTRNGHDWTEKFAPLAAALAALDLPACLIDGEIIARNREGNPDFAALQAVLKRGHGAQGPHDALELHAFDLLTLAGEDLTPYPNIERKERLEALLHEAASPVFFADHVIGAGEKLFAAMCAAGQEGIISKRIDAPYAGRRTREWVKIKCVRRQEFVIVGWTPSRARGRPFGALLLAQREGDALVYRGKVGTGFGGEMMEDIAAKLLAHRRKGAPVTVNAVEARGVHWAAPALVAEVSFAELTSEGRLRHASFIALREDKSAAEVVVETPAPAPQPTSDIVITHATRVLFPESGATKGDLAAYYAKVAPLMLPFAANRPVSLVRCPQGRAKSCFFQKHDSGSFGGHVAHVPIADKVGNFEDYLYIRDADGIAACVQMGTIEFHGWCARADAVEQPDRLIFDLDPDVGLEFADCRRAAFDIREQLAGLGLVSFAMVSGGKGVHVVAPLTRGHDWASHADFAARFAKAMATAKPDHYVATMSKAKRRGRIFIDWLRNQRGGTAVLPFSARARQGAPVAAPVSWPELETIDSAHPWSIRDAAVLVERMASGDLRGWGFASQTLPQA